MNIKITKLTVKYNGRTVGHLAERKDGRIIFQYTAEWIAGGFSISPFSLPLSNQVYSNPKNTFGGLYGVFADSLPDGWGELLVSRMLAKKGINYDRLPALTRLTLISGNGLGALTYEPCQVEKTKDGQVDLDKIAVEAARVLDDSENSDDFDFDAVYRLGGSSGGARPKAHIKDGREFWIVKFHCTQDPENIGQQEYTANTLARDCGIEVNEFKLFPSKLCAGYFGAKRFDIDGNKKRVHMVSLSSLLETTHRIPNLDYMHFFQVIQQISARQGDLIEAFRRMCFNVAFGNRDDHGKNFSFIYDEKIKGYRLSPAYDTTSTPHKGEHEMTVNGSGIPTEADLLEVAKSFKLSAEKCAEIIATIKER